MSKLYLYERAYFVGERSEAPDALELSGNNVNEVDTLLFFNNPHTKYFLRLRQREVVNTLVFAISNLLVWSNGSYYCEKLVFQLVVRFISYWWWASYTGRPRALAESSDSIYSYRKYRRWPLILSELSAITIDAIANSINRPGYYRSFQPEELSIQLAIAIDSINIIDSIIIIYSSGYYWSSRPELSALFTIAIVKSTNSIGSSGYYWSSL